VTNRGLLPLAPGNPEAGPSEDDVEIQTVDTDGGIVLQTEIDVLHNRRRKKDSVKYWKTTGNTIIPQQKESPAQIRPSKEETRAHLLNAKAEVSSRGEVPALKLVLLNLEATLEDLLSLLTTDSDGDGDLLVTTDTEGTDSVLGLGVDGGLTGELLEHLGGTGEPVTALTDTDVQAELLNEKLAANILGLVGGSGGSGGSGVSLSQKEKEKKRNSISQIFRNPASLRGPVLWE